MTVATGQKEAFRPLAEEVLDAFDRIAGAARERLGERRGSPLDAFASVNQATGEKLAKRAGEMRKERELDWRRLASEPAIARLVVADENDREETLYVSRAGTVDPTGIKLCSYLSPKGALASLAVGDERELTLPSGRQWFRLLERATFSPKPGQLWDAQPAIVQDMTGFPFTIRSLRDVLRATETDDAFEAYDQFMDGDDTIDENIFEGVQRGIQTAMQLRVRALLDAAQSDIFRLPVNTRLVLLGPAGTGKTTTLIKRLRQKVDWEHLDEGERAAIGEENAAAHATSWLMFTPTDLLKQYVQDAINKEGVPAPDGRIQTWRDYRRELARRHLPVLRSGGGAGLTMREGLGVLAPAALVDSIAWFEAFDAFQAAAFVGELATAASKLAGSGDAVVATLGERAVEIIARHPDRPLALLTELANLFEALQHEVDRLRDATRATLRQPLILHFRRDREAIDALARFVSTLSPEADDTGDDVDADGEDDDDDPVTAGGRASAEAACDPTSSLRCLGDGARVKRPHRHRERRRSCDGGEEPFDKRRERDDGKRSPSLPRAHRLRLLRPRGGRRRRGRDRLEFVTVHAFSCARSTRCRSKLACVAVATCAARAGRAPRRDTDRGISACRIGPALTRRVASPTHGRPAHPCG